MANANHPSGPATGWSKDQVEAFMSLMSQLGSVQPADALLEAVLQSARAQIEMVEMVRLSGSDPATFVALSGVKTQIKLKKKARRRRRRRGRKVKPSS